MDARSQIECSFRELLETQPYGKITVQDICDRAKVSRKTFYTHFHDKEDVACGYFTRMTVGRHTEAERHTRLHGA